MKMSVEFSLCLGHDEKAKVLYNFLASKEDYDFKLIFAIKIQVLNEGRNQS
jgi:hypothetical protein